MDVFLSLLPVVIIGLVLATKLQQKDIDFQSSLNPFVNFGRSTQLILVSIVVCLTLLSFIKDSSNLIMIFGLMFVLVIFYLKMSED